MSTSNTTTAAKQNTVPAHSQKNTGRSQQNVRGNTRQTKVEDEASSSAPVPSEKTSARSREGNAHRGPRPSQQKRRATRQETRVSKNDELVSSAAQSIQAAAAANRDAAQELKAEALEIAQERLLLKEAAAALETSSVKAAAAEPKTSTPLELVLWVPPAPPIDSDKTVGLGLRTETFEYDLPLPGRGWLSAAVIVLALLALGQWLYPVVFDLSARLDARVDAIRHRYNVYVGVRDGSFDLCDYSWLATLPDGSINAYPCWFRNMHGIFVWVIYSAVCLVAASMALAFLIALSQMLGGFEYLGGACKWLTNGVLRLLIWLSDSMSFPMKVLVLMMSLIVLLLAPYLWEVALLNNRKTDWELFYEFVLSPVLTEFTLNWHEVLALSLILAVRVVASVKIWLVLISSLIIARWIAIISLRSLGLWKAILYYRFDPTVITDKDVDHRVASARSTPLLMPSRVGNCHLTRSRRCVWLHMLLDLFIPRHDIVQIDVGHLLCCLSHRVDLPQLSAADQVKRIQEAGRALDLFNIPERLSLNDFHGNSTFIAWEIINARRCIRELRKPSGF